MHRIVFLLFSSFVLFACNSRHSDKIELPYYNDPEFTPIFLENKVNLSDSITHQIADFSFLNQDSVFISQRNIEGKIHVANFIFTSCAVICPTMTRHLKIVSDSLQRDDNVVFLSFSVTPWIDTPAILNRFKKSNEISNPNWHFLTGSKGDIYKLARTSYFAEEDLGFTKDSTEFLHTEHIILVDKTKRIRGVYNGTLSLEMKQLIEDIRTLEKE